VRVENRGAGLWYRGLSSGSGKGHFDKLGLLVNLVVNAALFDRDYFRKYAGSTASLDPASVHDLPDGFDHPGRPVKVNLVAA